MINKCNCGYTSDIYKKCKLSYCNIYYCEICLLKPEIFTCVRCENVLCLEHSKYYAKNRFCIWCAENKGNKHFSKLIISLIVVICLLFILISFETIRFLVNYSLKSICNNAFFSVFKFTEFFLIWIIISSFYWGVLYFILKKFKT